MKEQQIHSAFMVWLKKNGLYYVHSTFGKKATMTKDAPDFIILHCNRALMVECKTEKGGLTTGQKAMFEKLRAESGMVVHIARSVEQAVSAVEIWLGVEKRAVEPAEPEKVPSDPEPAKSVSATGVSAPHQFIGNLNGKDYVLIGDSTPGGQATLLRTATAADLINFPRQ